MKIEYINPFVEASYSVIKNMLKTKTIKRGKMTLKSSKSQTKGVSVIVGIAGEVEGSIILDMNLETALYVASHLNGDKYNDFEDEKTREIVSSTLRELGNIIAGNAVTILHERGFKFDITPPAFIAGKTIQIVPRQEDTIIQPLIVDDNYIIEVNITIRKRLI